MIHALLTDGRTILIGDNERIEVKTDLETVYNHFASELLRMQPRQGSQWSVRVGFRNPWWPIARLRHLDDPCEARKARS